MTSHITSQKPKIPKLRFSEFRGEWEDQRIGKFITEQSIYPDRKLPLYSLTIENGIIPKSKRYERSFLVKSESDSYKLMRSNEFAYNPMNLRFGAIARYKGVDNICVSKYYNVFSVNTNASPNFFEYFLTRRPMIIFYNRMSTGSLVEKQRVHYIDFVKFSKPIPSLPEQQKIASFLTSVDDWISNLKAQKEALEQYKKGMMQKLFSQEIRFKDENGSDFPDWEEKRLGEVLDYEQPTNYIVKSTEYSDDFDIPVLTAGKTFILGYTNEENGVFDKNDLPVIIFDDFTTASQFVDFQFKVKSSAMKILKNKDNINIKFVFEAMQLIRYEIGGHGRHWISKFSNLKILTPSLPEQQKIADFLTSIDTLINSKQLQISKAEEWKKGLMQGLFV